LGGLPTNGEEWLYHNLYKKSSKSRIISPEDVAALMKAFRAHHGVPLKVHHDVQIEAICLFDAVSSMGLPTTGVATPISLVKRGWRRKDAVIMELPSSTSIHFPQSFLDLS